jgi:O-antigen ligase
LIPPAAFLFILQFEHNITWRWLAALLTLALAVRQWSHGSPVPPLPCKAAISFWLACLLLSVVWAVDPAMSFSELRVDVFYSLLLFGSFYGLTQSARELEIWFNALAAGTFCVSAVAIVSFFHYGKWVPGHQHALGEFSTCLLTALPAIILLSLRNMPWSARGVWVRYALPAILLAGVLTLSRMFLGALILMLLVNTALQAWRHRLNLRQVFFVAAAVAAMTAAAGVALIAQRRGLKLTSDLRPAIWDVAVQRIAEHPWIGTGYGKLIDSEVYLRAFPGDSIQHPHNLLLSFAEQAGIFAALAIVIVFAALAREYWRAYRSHSRVVSYVGGAGLVMLTGVLAKNMTDMFFVRESAVMFWSINGMLLGFVRRAAQVSSVAPAAPPPGPLAEHA